MSWRHFFGSEDSIHGNASLDSVPLQTLCVPGLLPLLPGGKVASASCDILLLLVKIQRGRRIVQHKPFQSSELFRGKQAGSLATGSCRCHN